MRIFIWLILVGLLAAGCASKPPVREEIPWQQVKAQIPAGQVRVYAVRPFSNAAAGNQYSIRINGEHMTNIRTGSYFSCLVPSGDIKISAATVPNIFNIGLAQTLMGRPELTLKADAGEIVFINIGVAFSGGPVLGSAEPELGKRLVSEARKIEAVR